MKILVCNLSDYVGPGGDCTAYLSLRGKNRTSFVNEILVPARMGRPFSDVPDFVRQTMLSDKFRNLKHSLDRLVYLEITLRAARYYTLTGLINGMHIRIRPGEYYTSIARMVNVCPFYTEKQMRGSVERLVKAGFIKSRDLKRKRGRIITLVGWGDEYGQSKRQSDKWAQDIVKFPRPPSISVSKDDQKRAGRSPQVGQ